MGASIGVRGRWNMPSAKFKSAAMYGISRAIGHRDGPGWNVHLTRNGVHFSKPFPFSMYGGEEPALIRAQAWRDDIVKAHPPRTRVQIATQLKSNNTSGIPGVTCQLGRDGNVVGWIAGTTLSPGKKLTKYFSVGRHGAAQAKLLAIAERQRQLQQMTGLRAVHPAEATVRNAPATPIPPHIPVPVGKAEILMRTNKSGVAGVHRFPKHWGALTYYTVPGEGKKLVSKYFSVKTHGEEKAKALAIAERQKQRERVAQPIPRKGTKRERSS